MAEGAEQHREQGEPHREKVGWMSWLAGNRGMVIPVVVGVLALVLGGFFAYLTLRDSGSEAEAGADTTPSSAKVDTTRFVSRAGGFSVRVPNDLAASRKGKTAQFTAKDKSLVVTVGPGESGSLTQASKRFVATMKRGYAKFRLLGTQPQKVDGRPALASYGQATNASGVKIRFAAVVVRSKPRNYTISAYTAFDSDPSVVLPRVNAIINGFRVLAAKK
jgi:hypothetical protein